MPAVAVVEDRMHRVIVTVKPGDPHPTAAEAILSTLKARPDTGGWDWIIDVRLPFEPATPEEIAAIAHAFDAANRRLAYTVFVSEKPETFDRCAALDKVFKRRMHLVARSMQHAANLLPMDLPVI